MDIFSTTVEIIKLINNIYELCETYRDTDATIRAIRLRLESVGTRLELFQQYFRHSEASLTTRQGTSLKRSLQRVEDLLQDLSAKLPPLSNISAKLAWAGWGKRSAEQILDQLKDWDEDVRGTMFAIDILSRVRSDQALYKRLFDTGERALTTAWALSIRLNEPTLDKNLIPPFIPLQNLFLPPSHDGRRMIGTFGDRPVYVEALYIERNGDEERQKWANIRLASAFHSRHMPSMHLLSCEGISKDYDHDRVFLVYELPEGFFVNPSTHYLPTLAHALETQVRMALEDRFRLAVEVVTAVFEVHAAGWVHKSIRSDTILVSVVEAQVGRKEDAHVGPAFLIGFEAARPHVQDSDQLPEVDVAKRRYHHPERQGGRDVRVKKFDLRHDMYSLGAVLIEIGYRKSLRDIFSGLPQTAQMQASPAGELEMTHKRLVGYAHRLSDKMGSKYAGAALVCLTKSTEPGKPLDDLRQEFYEDVMRPLLEISKGLQVNFPLFSPARSDILFSFSIAARVPRNDQGNRPLR